MFPTTVWSTIREAGSADHAALDRLARRYRPAILAFLRKRGLGADAEDVCQDVFVRVLSGNVLRSADPERGRFRSLLLTITKRVIADRYRQAKPTPASLDADPADPNDARDDTFDREWAMCLLGLAFDRLQAEAPDAYATLQRHLVGDKQDRTRVWRARRKLVAFTRLAIAETCATHAEFEAEAVYLSRFVRPAEGA